MDTFWEIFTLVTGILYIILEIRQKNAMWVVGVVTSLAAMYVFFTKGLYASFGLNCYYLIVSFIGLWQWRRDSRAVLSAPPSSDAEAVSVAGSAGDSADDPLAVRLRILNWKVVAVSAVLFAVLTLVLGWAAAQLGDPMSHLDVAVAVMSAIATVWLSRCYKEQWLLWIVADLMSTGLCLAQNMWWMTALYGAYTLSAAYGYIHWKKHGHVIA